MLTTARVHWADTGDLFFASLDGTLFLGVTRQPGKQDEEAIKELFSAKLKRTLPMRVHRDLLASYGAEFTEIR
jgi:hypothetical protein